MCESATRIPARVLHDFTVHVRKHDAIIHYLALRSQGGKVRSSGFNRRCRTYFTKNQKNDIFLIVLKQNSLYFIFLSLKF